MRKIILILVFLLGQLASAESPSSWGEPRSEVAIYNARIMVAPGKTIPKGVLWIKDGRVVGAGKGLSVPASARRIDAKGKLIHAGFIDPYVVPSSLGGKKPDKNQKTAQRFVDHHQLAQLFEPKKEALEKFRKSGFTLVHAVPEVGVVRGQGVVYRTSPGQETELLLKPSASSNVGFETLTWAQAKPQFYPVSKMGNVAAIREFFLQSDWQRKHPEAPAQPALRSFGAVLQGERPLFAEARSYLDALSWLRLGREATGAKLILVLSGQEWKGLDWLAKMPAADGYILPLAFPATPKPNAHQDWSQFSLERLRHWYFAPGNAHWLARRGFRYALSSHRSKDLKSYQKSLKSVERVGVSRSGLLAGLTTEPARLLGLVDYGSLEAGKSATFVIRDEWLGAVEEVWVDGRRYPNFEKAAKPKKDKDEKKKKEPWTPKYMGEPGNFFPGVLSPSGVLIKNATLWTQGPQGTVVGDLLVQNGKVTAVGRGLSAPASFHRIDGSGLHVTPGLVDAHSHTAIDGMVNEPTLNVTAMCHIKDVINPFDHNMYLQLAGGTTTANLLHGSANSIGGKAVTLKWRYGKPPADLIFKGAPEGIKFALGENPKASNWSTDRSRYPQTRMGVMESIRGAFTSAKNYRAQTAPKPDLALEALVEVLDGKRKIHCHSYRQDEILSLIRVAEEVGFKVDVFQHVLEGYKVADELEAHGAAASTFADWWAYKYEVIDAIPYNPALMTRRGVSVSVNSDSNDLARRLNTEAGKSVRYGGLEPKQALDLVTMNAARQLGIETRVGSLEPGKDADFVIWNAPPLSQSAVCLETWIEGVRYFRRADEPKRVAQAEKEWQSLKEKAEAASK